MIDHVSNRARRAEFQDASHCIVPGRFVLTGAKKWRRPAERLKHHSEPVCRKRVAGRFEFIDEIGNMRMLFLREGVVVAKNGGLVFSSTTT